MPPKHKGQAFAFSVDFRDIKKEAKKFGKELGETVKDQFKADDIEGRLITNVVRRLSKRYPYAPHISVGRVQKVKNVTKYNYESLLIDSFAGVGKTYKITNTIIPLLKKRNLKYLLTSTTILNAKSWDEECKPINFYTKQPTKEMKRYLESFDVIVIDEVSQLTMQVINKLELLDVRFILIGDFNQCCSVDNYNYMKSDVIYRLVDYNVMNIEYHNKIRYSKKYFDFLAKIIEMKDDMRGICRYVKKHIKKCKHDYPTLNLVYTHRLIAYYAKLNIHCVTIHSYQGKTIKQRFGVCIRSINSYRILYTALSRATGFDNICLI